MTDRHPPLLDPRLPRDAEGHPVKGSLLKVGAGSTVEATVESNRPISSGEPEDS